MNRDLSTKLSSLGRLDPSNRQTASCKVCTRRAVLFDVVDFNKSCSKPDIYPFGLSGIQVPYLCCSFCQFIFTPFLDDWTTQDFARFIYNEDYLKVDGEYAGLRSEREAAAMASRLAGFQHLRILDYGSGSGTFAERLRSRGFDQIRSYDPFSSPSRSVDKFDVITCFEVLEHTISPRKCLDDILSFLEPGGCILFSTGIQPPNIAELRANWWYIAPRNGHVSIYSLHSLARLGHQRGLTFHAGDGLLGYGYSIPSQVSREILAGVGRSLQYLILNAPGASALPPEQHRFWHGVEGMNGRGTAYRWTASSEIVWTLEPKHLERCNLVITIPVQNEVEPGFAERCHLKVGDRSIPLVRHADALRASFSIDAPVEAVVKLILPPSLRPCDLRQVSDTRLLGLAIAIGNASF